MNSVSVAASTDSSAGKLQANKLAHAAAESDNDQVVVSAVKDCAEPTTTTTVVIIKAEACEESSASATLTNNQNGGSATIVAAKGALNAAEVIGRPENGPVDSSDSKGDAKAATNGANQNRMIRTTSAKGKHLTRSHAMRESASPPRTPVLRECNGQLTGAQSPDGQDTVNGLIPTMAEVLTPPKIYPADSGKNTSQLDLDFPKLNAPKPKSPRNMDKSQSSDSSKSVNSLDTHSPTTTLNRKGGDGRNLSPSSQHSGKEHDNSPLLSPSSYDNRSSGREHSKSPSGENRNSSYHGSSGGKKHKGASGAKNANKPRLKAQGSSSSVEGNNNNSTVFISKDNSFEQFTDQSGVDLIKFFRETLNKNAKDRSMLLKIEKELHDLATDRNRHQVKFPSMSSYNRMLIHRCAAYFGMDHNVDTSQTSVIVAVTKSTRIPEILFDTLIRESLDEPRKSILKRDSHSFDECRQSLLPNPDRGLLDRKAKSFEEREEDYEKARRRIFKGRELVGYHRGMEMQDENSWPWSSTESSDNSSKIKAQNNRLLKVHSLSVDTRHDRPSVSKSHSFGGYGGPSGGSGGGGGSHHNHHLNRGDSITSTKSAGPRFFTKQDSMGGTPWRLSPSSSGYKTQTQSLRSDSVTPSPTGYGSGGDHTPEPQSAQSPASGNRSVVWAVTDMASVPRGSVLIDPQTLQPIVNQDGSIYYFDPSNVPPMALKMGHHGHMNRHYPPPFMSGIGGGGGHPSGGRRRPDRNKGTAEEMVVCREKSSSNAGSIDVIPEDQFHGNCMPTEVNAASTNNSGSAVPSEEGSHYTKGETSSPDDLEDTSDKVYVSGGVDDEVAQEGEEEPEQLVDNVERIFVPEHKNQATSPSHPLAQPEEFVEAAAAAAAASDAELASSSQCLTPQPPPSPKQQQQQQLHDQQELQRPITPPTSLPVPVPSDPVSLELPAAEEATSESLQDESSEVPPSNEPEDASRNEEVADVNVDSSSSAPPLNVVTNASPSNDSHTLTISTTCTSSSLTNNTTTTQSGAASVVVSKPETISSSGSSVARAAPVYKPFNRNYYNNNSQGDSRSNSTTTIASPSITSTSYQVHPQFVAHPQMRAEDHMHGYQQTGITYSTTAIDANGNTFAGAANMPYATTYQQMPESGGYMVYAAPYPMEAVGEMPGYYVPVYDQAGNATLVPATTGREPQQAAILQAAPPPGTHVYQAAPNTTALIPAGSQLVYTADGQFGTANMQQPQQFAVPAASYPPGTTVTYATPYGTAYNAAPSTYHANFWGQPMTTYYVSSPATQSVPQAAVPIQIPVPLQQHQQQMPPPPANGKNTGSYSNPPTPQATTFAGNPFAGGGGGPQPQPMHMQSMVSASGGGVDGSGMPQPVYAISTGMQMQMGGPHVQQNKYQNVYPYASPAVVPLPPVVATPPTAIYQPTPPPYQPPVVHSSGKPATTNSPPQTSVAVSAADLQTNSSSATSTPLQKSPPTQMPDTTPSTAGATGPGGGYDRKPRRGPPNEMGNMSHQPSHPHSGYPRAQGYMGNGGYNPRNQTYTPRSYAPRKHYSAAATENGPNGYGQNKTIVLNAPMQQSQSTGSPSIYGHYHPSVQSHSHQGAPTHQPGIRGPRPKPANLDLRRTGSHYQSQAAGGTTASTGSATTGVGNGNSQRNTPSTNSTESNNSPNSVTGTSGGMADHSRGGGAAAGGGGGGQMGYYPSPNATGGVHPGGHPLVMHQPLMGSPANPVAPGGHPGMYVKLGQTYFPHPTLGTPMGGNRRSPPNEIRSQFNHHHHSLTTGLYPMNMQITGPRHGAGGPRHSHHHNSYKGSR